MGFSTRVTGIRLDRRRDERSGRADAHVRKTDTHVWEYIDARAPVSPRLRRKTSSEDLAAAVGGEGGDNRLDIGGADVQMGDQPQACCRTDADATLGQEGMQRGRLVAQGEIDHVGLHRLHLIAELARAVPSCAAWGVVLGQPLDLVIEDMQAGGREDAGLRMPPPTTLRQRRALAMSAASPQSTEPTGAPRPLDRQTDTESKCWLISRTGTPSLTAALYSRAPSRCRARPCSRVKARAAAR